MRKTGRTRIALYDVFTYDVWGNEEDGYEVNDVFLFARGAEIGQEEIEYNENTEHSFLCWEVPESELIEALGIKHGTDIDVEGEECFVLAVNTSVDCYPIGELRFVGLKGKD